MRHAHRHAFDRGADAVTPAHMLMGILDEGTGLPKTVRKHVQASVIQTIRLAIEKVSPKSSPRLVATLVATRWDRLRLFYPTPFRGYAITLGRVILTFCGLTDDQFTLDCKTAHAMPEMQERC